MRPRCAPSSRGLRAAGATPADRLAIRTRAGKGVAGRARAGCVAASLPLLNLMRLKSEIFAAALVRNAFARGDFAAIERKGAAEGGAVFVRQSFRDGTESLYAPAPQSFFDDETTGRRLFELRLDRQPREAVSEALDREIRFDPDLWIVALETDEIGALVEQAAAERDDLLFRR